MKEQKIFDSRYINKFVSVNASRDFDTGKVNELVADVKVLGEKTDPILLEKTKGVTKYGYGRETE